MSDILDPRLQEMLDHHAITRLLAEYAHGCDRCDTERMASVYWPDSWDDHGRDQATGPDFAELMTQRIIPANCETLSHLMGQSLITIDGDIAGAETYYLAVTRATDEDGQPSCHQLGGRYIDRLERRPNADGQPVWKISHRTCLRDWSVSLKVDDDRFALAQLKPGHRSGDDPSYPVLGWRHRAA